MPLPDSVLEPDLQDAGSPGPAAAAMATAAAWLRSVPIRVWTRLALLAAVLLAGLALVTLTPVGEYFEQERVIALLEQIRGLAWAPAALVGVYVVSAPLGFVPVSPLIAAGGIVYGPVEGTLYNMTGLILASMSAFYVARGLGREAVVELAGPRLRRAERLFDKRSFWPLVQVRFLPVPFSVVSYAAALAGIGSTRFFIASVAALLPATAAHTYFLAEMILNPGVKTVAIYLVVMGSLNLLIGWQNVRQGWHRRRRYRELVEQRRQRSG